MVGRYDKANLKDIKLVEKGGSYFLDVTYEYEDKDGIYELNIPCLHLPIYTNMIPPYRIDVRMVGPDDLTVDLGFGDLKVLVDFETDTRYTIKEIKKKTRKMTLAEIEAKLGHKIELVSE